MSRKYHTKIHKYQMETILLKLHNARAIKRNNLLGQNLSIAIGLRCLNICCFLFHPSPKLDAVKFVRKPSVHGLIA